MDDVFAVLCFFAIALALITVVGHGIWVGLAKLFGGGKQPPPRPPSPRPENARSVACCQVCGNMVYGGRASCPRCGAATSKPAERATHETVQAIECRTAIRQIQRLWHAGLIEDALHERLVRLLEAHPEPPRVPHAQAATIEAADPASSIPLAEITEPMLAPTMTSPVVEAEIVMATIVSPQVQPAPVRTPIAPEPEPSPHRPLGAMLQAFLESRNIRWGELASGVLIVGSAVGLVISLRATLRDVIPYFPALIFMLATAAIYGAGMYTLRRWRLRSTSRGLLSIAMLLVPLNFLAAVLLSESRSVTDPLYWAAVTIGFVGFGWITYSACRELVPWTGGWLAAGIMGSCTTQLVIERVVAEGESRPTFLLGLAALPVLAFIVAIAKSLIIGIQVQRFTPRRVGQLYLAVGAAGFALASPLAMMVWRAASTLDTLGLIAPWLSLIAAAVTAVGLLVHGKIRSAGWRTSGTAVALIGAAAMVGTGALAWPRPDVLIAVGVLNFVTITLLARASRLPVLHSVAVVCLAVAALLGVERGLLSAGPLEAVASRELMQQFLSGRSALLWTLLAGAAAAVALVLLRKRLAHEALAYFRAAALIAVAGFAGALYAGFWTQTDPRQATFVFALDAAGLIAAAAVMRRSAATYASSALVLLAILHGLLYNPVGEMLLRSLPPDEQYRWSAVLLTHGALIAGLAAAAAIAAAQFRHLRDRATEVARSFTTPLATTALVSSGIVLIMASMVGEARFALHAGLVLGVAAIWFTMSLVLRGRPILSAAQAFATLGICYLTTAICQRFNWWTAEWLDPRHIEIQLITLSVWAVACHGVRLLAQRRPSLSGMAKPIEIPVERVLVYVLAAATVVAAIAGCWPGVYEQLGQFESLSAMAVWQHVHAFAHGAGAWGVLATVALAAAVVMWQTTRREDVVFWLLLAAAVPLFAACRFEAQQSTAAALASGLGLYFVVGVLLASARQPILKWVAGLPGNRKHRATSETFGATALTYVSLSLVGVFPVLLLAGAATLAAGQGRLLLPAAGSLFEQLGPTITWCLPLVLLGLGLAIASARERVSVVALGACACIMAATVLATVIPTWLAGRWLDTVSLAAILQQTTIVASLLALAWLVCERFALRRQEALESADHDAFATLNVRVDDPLSAQIGLVGLLCAILSAWPGMAIFYAPGALPAIVTTLGQWPSFLALVLGAAAFAFAQQRDGSRKFKRASIVNAVLFLSVLAMPLVAAAVGARSAGNWLAFHVLSAGWGALAVLTTAARCSTVRYRADNADGELKSDRGAAWLSSGTMNAFATLAAGLCILFAVRGATLDPLRPWWSTGLAVVAAIVAGAHAVRTRRESLAYVTTVLGVVALMLYHVGLPTGWGMVTTIEVAQQAVCLVALLATTWLILVTRTERGELDETRRRTFGLPLSRTTLVIGLLAAAGTVALCTLITRWNTSLHATPQATTTGAWGWAMFACLGALCAVTLWSRDARLAPAGLYALGLIGIGLVLDTVPLKHTRWAVGLVAGAAAWVALTGMLWNLRASWIRIGQQLRMRQPEETVHSVWRWLPVMSMLLTVAVIFASGCAGLFGTKPFTRTMAAVAVALTAPGLAMLGHGHLSRRMPRWALLVSGIAAVYLGWSLVPHVPEGTFWLRMGIRTLVALGAMTAVYGLGLVRLMDKARDWYAAVRQSAGVLGAASLLSLLGVLALEAVHFKSDGGVVAITDVAQVTLVLVFLAGALLSLALQKGADPLGLSEKGRMLYVYAAQIVLALLFAHVYLTMPYLFHGRLRPYWPLIVMSVSYAGIVFGILAKRAGLRVLSEPLERTGGFLPLLPALGFWFLTSQISYSTVMAAAAVAYVLLSLTEKRLLYRVAAAIAGNAALWALMHEQGFLPWHYPSFWAVPPAVCLLVAAQLNRRRLSNEQLTAVRYLSITVIYLSSTGQVWLQLGQALWPPMLLALLSVAGILIGMALRVRAFLYQGMSFLALAVLSMIWHASRNIGHVWPWWAFGVVLGLSILALFGIFEKKRPEVLLLVERLRQWER